MNDNFTLSFSKYALLNIPEQVVVGGSSKDQTKGVMNFDKNSSNTDLRFFNFQPGGNADLPANFSDQMVESLRNYVSNYDATLRESRINQNTDFFNVNELTTSTEMIFWKWCKKLNLFDLEPAEHQIDWDKNLSDFTNINGTDNTFFQKYLWKEREIKHYSGILVDDGGSPKITILGVARFKVGDTINFSGDTTTIISGDISGGTDYNISFTSTETIIILSSGNAVGSENTEIFLKYHRLIECVGDIQSVSQIQTSRHNFTDISIQIPHHGGATPTILFHNDNTSNYYPGMEMPVLPQEQQVEINGSENTNSPIRKNPENYPGTFFGYFDTYDKTYKCNIGDRNRYSGDYYGVNLTNNNGIDENDYEEKLTDFDSSNIDGMKIDFNQDHYLKMNLPEYLIKNFDEFNSAYFDESPRDYTFNAILWYYDLDDGSGEIVTNLFGIEFLNNPNDDNDDCDVNNKLITPYSKLVSNGEQDGYSYIFDLNLNINIDNDVLPLSYDPTTIHNQFSFDLYQNILQSNALLQESFINIVDGHVDIQEELFSLRSQIMSDIDKEKMSKQINNLNDLLTLYSTMQIVDSNTITTEVLYEGAYPTIKLNNINTSYDDIINLNISDVYEYIDSNPTLNYNIPVSKKNKTRLNIINENNNFNGKTKILINQDLNYKQEMEIYITPKMSETVTDLDIYINYNDGDVISEEQLIFTTLPIDLTHYDANIPDNSIYNSGKYINSLLETYSNSISYNGTTNETTIDIMNPLFVINDYIYIDNFYLDDGVSIIDKSGVYKIKTHNTTNIIIELDTDNMTLSSTLKLTYYKGIKYNILRQSEAENDTISNRYLITKELL